MREERRKILLADRSKVQPFAILLTRTESTLFNGFAMSVSDSGSLVRCHVGNDVASMRLPWIDATAGRGSRYRRPPEGKGRGRGSAGRHSLARACWEGSGWRA